MPKPSAKYELLQVRLGRSLAEYLQAARADGRDWRTIASDLTTLTGVSVSYETLRSWAPEPTRAAL